MQLLNCGIYLSADAEQGSKILYIACMEELLGLLLLKEEPFEMKQLENLHKNSVDCIDQLSLGKS